jgi:hypothetical protein
MSSALNGINGINAAALALQALAAANPALLMSQNPWLAGHMHQMLGGMGAMGPGGAQLGQIPATGPMSMAPVDPAQLAAAQQLGQQLNGTGEFGSAVVLGPRSSSWWRSRLRVLALLVCRQLAVVGASAT